MDRKDALKMAEQEICGHRVEDYGTPEDNFRIISELWSTYLGRDVTSCDVAIMMALMKIARIKSKTKSDSFIDLIGYSACAAELACVETKKDKE